MSTIRHKTFLSQKGDGYGSVCWYVDASSQYGKHHYSGVRVSDCYRTVEIEFGFSDKEDHNIGVEKIDTFIDALLKFRETYKDSYVEKKPRYF